MIQWVFQGSDAGPAHHTAALQPRWRVTWKTTGCSCTRDPGSEGLVQPLANTARTVPAGGRSPGNSQQMLEPVKCVLLLSCDCCFTTGKFWSIFNGSNKNGAGEVSVIWALTLFCWKTMSATYSSVRKKQAKVNLKQCLCPNSIWCSWLIIVCFSLVTFHPKHWGIWCKAVSVM